MAWQFYHVTTGTLADQRAQEELMKRGKGDRKVTFKLPLHWFEDFDVFTDFLLQDLYAVEETGVGEALHYYFVESITYDFMKETLVITAIDLQWILSQFFIAGDENVIALNWDSASVLDKIYGYGCDEITGQFANGDEGKMALSEEV